jgi:deoxyribonuclease IV
MEQRPAKPQPGATTLQIGSHVGRSDPLRGAVDRGANIIQLYASAPRAWRDPVTKGDESELAAAPVEIVVHAPYLINPASDDTELRSRSRRALTVQCEAAQRMGALGVVVHAGRLTSSHEPAPVAAGTTDGPAPIDEDLVRGIANWLETLDGIELSCRLLIENTAGGRRAIGRRTDHLVALVRMLRAEGHDVGVVFDTCHAHAARLDLIAAVEELIGGLGAIDLVHANDSRDPAGSGRDRHQNLGAGAIDPEVLVAAVAAASAPTVVETPGPAASQSADIEWLRSRLGDR